MAVKNLVTLGIDSELLARLSRRVEADIAADRFDGAAIAISRRGERNLRTVQGDADHSARGKLSLEGTIASFAVGKPFTNALVLR